MQQNARMQQHMEAQKQAMLQQQQKQAMLQQQQQQAQLQPQQAQLQPQQPMQQAMQPNLDHITKLKIFDTIHDFGKKDARNNDATQEIIVDILKDKLKIKCKKKCTISDILKEITNENITSTGSKGKIPTYERVVTDYMEYKYSDVRRKQKREDVNQCVEEDKYIINSLVIIYE